MRKAALSQPVNLIFLLRAQAARQMPRKRNSPCCRAARETVNGAARSIDQLTNLQGVDEADLGNFCFDGCLSGGARTSEPHLVLELRRKSDIPKGFTYLQDLGLVA